MNWLYFVSLFLFLLASFAYNKSSQNVGEQADPSSALGFFYALFGNLLSTVAIIGLLVWGFFIFAWWVPIIAIVVGQFVVGYVYSILPIGLTIVVSAFPLGLISCAVLIFTRINS